MIRRCQHQSKPDPPGGERPVRIASTGPHRRLAWTLATVVAVSVAASASSGPAPSSPGGPLDRAGHLTRDSFVGIQDVHRLPAALPPHLLPLDEPLRLVPVDSSGTRVAPGAAPNTTAEGDIPAGALRAYRAAALELRASDPSCGLDWSLLAGIGRVESNHGRYGGASLGPDGVARPLIIGIPLDGRPGVARIGDSDGGLLDGDTTFDRAVGPMQFIPGTWARSGVDGDGDGRSDPHDIDDAALGAARYLCAGDARLDDVPGARTALMRYNHSADYGLRVLGLAATYRLGVSVDGTTAASSPTPEPNPTAGPEPAPAPSPGVAATAVLVTASPAVTPTPTTVPAPTSEPAGCPLPSETLPTTPAPGPTAPPTTTATVLAPEPTPAPSVHGLVALPD